MSIGIDTLLVAQLSNTHFRCYGANLRRLELLAERDSWRLLPEDIYDTLSRCPKLEHLTLCTVCTYMEDLTLANAYDAGATTTVHLSNLRCFILEDTTTESLHLLSYIGFVSKKCDFHWTIVEPFGRLGYYVETLSDSLVRCLDAFGDKTFPSFTPSALLIEILLDFEGQHLRSDDRIVYEWPEEMRLTFSKSVSSSMAQYVTRHPSLPGPMYRDLSHAPGSPRRSFGVRSGMLSKYPEEKNQRQRPMQYAHQWAKRSKPVDVPDLAEVISTFMALVPRLNGFRAATAIIVPSHAYIPRLPKAWCTLLKNCDIRTLEVGTVSFDRELLSLCEYLATLPLASPHPELSAVHCPNYTGDGSLSEKQFGSLMEKKMGVRGACVDTKWYAPLLR